MGPMIYDTLKLARALQPAFEAEQAEALAAAINVSAGDELATKADLRTAVAELRTEIAGVRTEIAGVRAEMLKLITAQTFVILGAVAALLHFVR